MDLAEPILGPTGKPPVSFDGNQQIGSRSLSPYVTGVQNTQPPKVCWKNRLWSFGNSVGWLSRSAGMESG
jgi:hypothetical protein